MGFRFRKSFKLAPGVRMNLSKSGMSWTLGPRGASVGIGKRGVYSNTGIPGTGISYRQRLDGGATRSRKRIANNPKISIPVSIGVDDDGSLQLLDSGGNRIPEQLVKVAKKQHGDTIAALMQSKCDEINSQINALGEIHFYTPSPNLKPRYEMSPFVESIPAAPTPLTIGFFASLFPSRRKSVELQNKINDEHYAKLLSDWEIRKAKHEALEQRRKTTVEHVIYENVAAMEEFLEHNLRGVIWPRETTVSVEVRESGKVVFIDVDLPEIEDMPTKNAVVPKRGNKLSVKEMSETQIRRLYMNHIHAIGFRIVGEAFYAVPLAQKATVSAYSQRTNKSTAVKEDQYLYSVQVDRESWSKINFDGLRSIDVIEAIGSFEIKRDMTKTGIFRPIVPFGPS